MRFASIAGLLLITETCAAAAVAAVESPGGGDATVAVGVARVDVTPEYPIRLSGYGNRRAESEGVAQRLWAKALAIGSDDAGAAVLVTVDNCGIPAWMTEKVADALQKRCRLPRERFVIASSHTHTGPCVSGALPTLFGQPVPAEHQEHIDRYTRELVKQLEQVAVDALAGRKPATLAWAQGRATFAMNRRPLQGGRSTGINVNKAGVVDHDLPMLRVSDPDGKLRAIVVNYACHCTTHGGEFNRICGDWAGHAQEFVERDNPGAVCLVTIGCGGDANPEPRIKDEYVAQHGREIADEVGRLLKTQLTPLAGPPACRLERIKLEFHAPPTREQWEQRAKGTDAAAYQAKLQVERLDRGETTQTELDYPVQTWAFGRELVMVFLGGEVVADYALAIKKEYGRDRVWVTAYANDVPCYIASRRMIPEGGYEVEHSMIYYDRPSRLADDTEDRIMRAVRRLMPAELRLSRQQGQ